ncbi:hypothetical protein BDR22DRAFT_808942 [Usnea florida]
MDFVKNVMSGGDGGKEGQGNPQSGGSGGRFLDDIGDKLNSAAGGGKESEKNEDLIDKGGRLIFCAQYGMGQGDQSNESALEQAKDEQISDEVRRQFKQRTREEIPVEDKKTAFGEGKGGGAGDGDETIARLRGAPFIFGLRRREDDWCG